MLVERDGLGSFVVPDAYQALFKMVSNGASIATLVDSLKSAPGENRFAGLLKFLSFLADRDMLADPRAIQLVESLRPDYDWNDSPAFEPLVSIELLRLRPGAALSVATSQAWAVAMAAAGALIVVKFLGAIASGNWASARWTEDSNALAALIALAFAFSIGRSVCALALFFCMRFLTSFAPAVHLRLDAVSLSLAVDDFSRARGGDRFLLATAGAVGLVAIAGALPMTAAFGRTDIAGFLPVFTYLVVLADLSPLRKSLFTEWLRAYYNRTENERSVSAIQVGATIAWICALLWFVVTAVPLLFVQLRSRFDMTDHASWLPLGLLILLVGIVAASFLDDLFNAPLWSAGSGRGRARRMWRRRRPTMPVPEAIQRGKAPGIDDLRQLPLLRQIDRDTRERLIERAEVVDLDVGEAFCRAGGKDRALFILLSGRAAVVKRSASRHSKLMAFLGPGAVFGEVAFFLGLQRTADVVASEPSRALKIVHDEDTMSTVDSSKSEELQTRAWFLQALVSSPVFKELPSEAMDALIVSGKKRLYRAGESVFSEGESADGCYFLVQGQASVVQNLQLINRMKAGDVFGEIGLIRPNTLRTATVKADTDLITVRIDGPHFWNLLRSHLPIAVEMERIAQERLKRSAAASARTE
jgi:CRP-like cAMP-binding protein